MVEDKHQYYFWKSRHTIAEEEVPDSEESVERQVTCEQTHQPVGGEHEGLHAVLLQMFVCSRARPLQNPSQ